jgi:hypothetical protein
MGTPPCHFAASRPLTLTSDVGVYETDAFILDEADENFNLPIGWLIRSHYTCASQESCHLHMTSEPISSALRKLSSEAFVTRHSRRRRTRWANRPMSN